jgi:hypothetical protein
MSCDEQQIWNGEPIEEETSDADLSMSMARFIHSGYWIRSVSPGA